MKLEVDATALRGSLLLLRLGIFVVMFMWTLDKLINPEHAGAVFANFYGIEGSGAAYLMVIGLLELVVVLAFVAGAFRTVTYGLVLAMHTVSTLSSYAQYFDAFNNLLFFAAWPMLAACVVLFWLRDHDTLLAWDGRETTA
jgi:hypothetical protein